MDENLSIRLSISGASERVRITSTFGNRMKLFGKHKDVLANEVRNDGREALPLLFSNST